MVKVRGTGVEVAVGGKGVAVGLVENPTPQPVNKVIINKAVMNLLKREVDILFPNYD